MEVDGVFSGGGIKAFAFLGALEVCEKRGITFNRVAGTSAGALIASLIAAGYRHEEVRQILNAQDTGNFLDPHPFAKKLPFLKWLSLYFRLGLYRGEYIEKWIDRLLAQKGVRTFGDLPDNLFIIGTDITNGRLAVFPDDLEPYYGIKPSNFPVSKAVRISISIPYFFQPIKLLTKSNYLSLFIDGGTLSNFPFWIFTSEENTKVRPTLGIKLSAKKSSLPKQKIDNAVDMLPAIIWTMIQAHDSRYVSEETAKDIMFIPINDISATDFDLDAEEKRYLFEIGRLKAESFFRKWSG
ncbi:patatin-like phospholipase family protein [Tenuibacillus multivorans]|uniref:NTE family protein n=1 Tax=Tenuibacillus multivorans TaxID=237069 RepID=A0A1G9Z8F3_9BACI|nr:patatin-like phospholipase family protein [Tenuibacillus multivorans]GEL77354.1 hypothetical protein TMU01_15890 [Tenuibacillus multivorans]SDN17639.1 NTE family protein [Tenuibacillus multivorans]